MIKQNFGDNRKISLHTEENQRRATYDVFVSVNSAFMLL